MILRKFASPDNLDSFSSKFRRKRFLLFLDFLKRNKIEDPKIIDVGGTCNYWELMNSDHQNNFKPVIVNISNEHLLSENYNSIIGDGKSLSFIKDKSFDVAYSNSMIEHLSSLDEQTEMAISIKRVAKHYFIQTPAFIFPIEPHFLFPFFHWLPKKIRIFLVLNFNLGWFNKCKNKAEAENLISSIRIMKKRELQKKFYDSKIVTERFFLIAKSYIVIK